MLTQTEINIEDIDWECLNLLSKKEKISIPDLIGRSVTNYLEQYEDARLLERALLAEKESEGKSQFTLEEVCQRYDIKLT
jgi:hypothetical protein